MDALTLGNWVLWVIPAAGGLWALWQLTERITSKFAKQSEVTAMSAALTLLLDDEEKGAVRRREYEHHNDTVKNAQNARDATVDKLLAAHDKAIGEGRDRVDEVRALLHKGLGEIKDILLARGK